MTAVLRCTKDGVQIFSDVAFAGMVSDLTVVLIGTQIAKFFAVFTIAMTHHIQIVAARQPQGADVCTANMIAKTVIAVKDRHRKAKLTGGLNFCRICKSALPHHRR